MSTDLRHALRDAVTEAPSNRLDPQAVIEAGRHRVRRRAGVAVVMGVLSVGAVVVSTAVLGRPERTDPDPPPAEVVRLGLEQAQPLQLDVLATARTASNTDFLEYDHLEGITADGLVLRSRFREVDRQVELGLFDLVTRETQWLPPAPGAPGEVRALDLAVDRLVLAERKTHGQDLLVFDRTSGTWQRRAVPVSASMEAHMDPLLVLGADDRVFIGSTLEGEAGPVHWWSAALDEGGQAREEHALTGSTIAWADGTQVTADPDGRVLLSGPGDDRVLGDARPAGCDTPADHPEWPVQVTMAGDRPVVTYYCESGTATADAHTVVYDPDGQTQVEVVGASVLAADDQHVIVVAGNSFQLGVRARHSADSTYVVDLEALTIGRVGAGPHEPQVAIVDGLLLWNVPGPGDDNDAYDVQWKVARLD